MYLRVRLLFDPPTTSYLINSMDQQRQELEWRLNVVREGDLYPAPTPLTEGVVLMVAITTVPTIVDINHYGGDTFTLEIRASAAVTDGMVWDAEIRSARDAAVVDAVFTITPPVASGGPAYATLSSVDSARLVVGAPIVNRRMPDGSLRAVKQYSGVWDCQVSHPTLPDPVRTLIQGTFVIAIDVTRPA